MKLVVYRTVINLPSSFRFQIQHPYKGTVSCTGLPVQGTKYVACSQPIRTVDWLHDGTVLVLSYYGMIAYSSTVVPRCYSTVVRGDLPSC